EAAAAVVEARAAFVDVGGDAHVASTLALSEAYLAVEAGETLRGLQLRSQLEDQAGSLLARRLAVLGELEASAGDTTAAKATAERLRATDDADPYVGAMVSSVLAKVAEVDGDTRTAAEHVVSAIAVFDAVDARFEASRSRLAP